MSVDLVTCASPGPRVDPRALGRGELGHGGIFVALLAGEADAAVWPPSQACPNVPSAALRVVWLAGHRSVEIYNSDPHRLMNACFEYYSVNVKTSLLRKPWCMSERLLKNNSCVSLALRLVIRSEQRFFIVMGVFSVIHPIVQTPGAFR